MIRIDARSDGNGERWFELRKNRILVIATYDFDEVCRRLRELEIERPEQLVDAAARWGAVEVHEDSNPNWLGG
jgi:hypothetical protein